MMATTITDRIAAWARLLPYDHSPAARRIGDRVPQHDGRTGGAQLRIRPGNSACPGAGLITGHDAGVKPSVRRVVAVRCGVRQAVREFEGDARRRLVVDYRYLADGIIFGEWDGYVKGVQDTSDLSYQRPLEMPDELLAQLRGAEG